MVWIYGGAYMFGGSGEPGYDGSPFARGGAVFVSLLANGLTLLGLGAPYRYGLNGLLILLALALGVTRRR